MAVLKDILYKVAIEVVKGSTEMTIGKIEFDSRKVQENDVFVAIRGSVSDGHDYIEKAIPQTTTVDQTYTVKKGDTLGAIALKNGTTVKNLMQKNELKNSVLQVGQKLKI